MYFPHMYNAFSAAYTHTSNRTISSVPCMHGVRLHTYVLTSWPDLCPIDSGKVRVCKKGRCLLGLNGAIARAAGLLLCPWPLYRPAPSVRSLTQIALAPAVDPFQSRLRRMQMRLWVAGQRRCLPQGLPNQLCLLDYRTHRAGPTELRDGCMTGAAKGREMPIWMLTGRACWQAATSATVEAADCTARPSTCSQMRRKAVRHPSQHTAQQHRSGIGRSAGGGPHRSIGRYRPKPKRTHPRDCGTAPHRVARMRLFHQQTIFTCAVNPMAPCQLWSQPPSTSNMRASVHSAALPARLECRSPVPSVVLAVCAPLALAPRQAQASAAGLANACSPCRNRGRARESGRAPGHGHAPSCARGRHPAAHRQGKGKAAHTRNIRAVEAGEH